MKIKNKNKLPFLNNNNISKKTKLMMVKSITFSLNSYNISKKLYDNFNEYNYISIGIHYLNNILDNHLQKIKSNFYINLLYFYYDLKDNINYINLRKLLSNILLKKIITKKITILKYYFLKYHSRAFSHFVENNISYIIDKNELAKLKKINILQEQKISKFKNLLKHYEEKDENQKIEQNNIVTNYKSKLDKIKQNYEDLISKNSAEHTQELMKLSNENILKRQTINKLNKQIEEQQNLLENLNKKLILCQDNNRQKEENINQKIKNIKSQYNNFQNIIDDLNKKIENLKNENEGYKNKAKELLNIEKEYINIKNENEMLKNNNDNLNNKYIILRKDYVQMKINFENNKKEFEKAIKEMDTYSQLLITLENKMNKAEKDKIKAELERDRAVQETREIRQRYIDIMSNNT